jgi:hypothetical protein
MPQPGLLLLTISGATCFLVFMATFEGCFCVGIRVLLLGKTGAWLGQRPIYRKVEDSYKRELKLVAWGFLFPGWRTDFLLHPFLQGEQLNALLEERAASPRTSHRPQAALRGALYIGKLLVDAAQHEVAADE